MSISSDFLKICSQMLTAELKQKSGKIMNEAISKKNLTDASTTCDIEDFINIVELNISAVSGKKKAVSLCKSLREKVMELDLNNQTKEMRNTICGEPKDLNINDFLARINAENMKPKVSEIKTAEKPVLPDPQVSPVSHDTQVPPVPPAAQAPQVSSAPPVAQEISSVPPVGHEVSPVPPDTHVPAASPVPPAAQAIPTPVPPTPQVPPVLPNSLNSQVPQDLPLNIDINNFLAKNPLPAESEIIRISADLALKSKSDAEEVKKQIIERIKSNFRIELNKKVIKIEIDKFLFGFPKPVKEDIDDFVNYISLLNLRFVEAELREQIETERLYRKFQDPVLQVATSEIDRFISLLKSYTEKTDVIRVLNENELSYLIKNENGISQMLLFDLLEIMALIERDSPGGLYLNQMVGKTSM